MQQELLEKNLHQLEMKIERTLATLQQPALAEKNRKAALLQVQQVLQQCAACTHLAETQLYPLADAYEPALVDALRQQQRTISAHHLAASVAAYSGGRQNNIAAFGELLQQHAQYLQRLQRYLLPLLCRYYGCTLVQDTADHSGKTSPEAASAMEHRVFRAMLHRAETELAQSSVAAPTINRHAVALHC